MNIVMVLGAMSSYHIVRAQYATSLLSAAANTLIVVERVGQQKEYVLFGGGRSSTIRIERAYDATNLSPDNATSRRQLTHLLERLEPDVVVFSLSSPVYFAVLDWCLCNRIPAICVGDSTAWDYRRVWWREIPKRRIIRAFATVFIAGTASRDYFRTLGVPENRTFLGFDAVDNAYFRTSSDYLKTMAVHFRDKLHLCRPFFLVVGRFIPEKNLLRLLDAYALYQRKAQKDSGAAPCPNDPWDLVIAGDGELRGKLQEHIRSLGLKYVSHVGECGNSSVQQPKASVQLVGFVRYEDLPKYYALAECLILPSQKDTWGLVVNEAMASGLPVLVSKRCGCAQDLVDDGKNGFLIDPFSVDDIAEKMCWMVRLSDDQRRAMGNRGREIIAAWGPERFAQGLKAAVDKAIEMGPRAVSLIDILLLRAMSLRS